MQICLPTNSFRPKLKNIEKQKSARQPDDVYHPVSELSDISYLLEYSRKSRSKHSINTIDSIIFAFNGDNMKSNNKKKEFVKDTREKDTRFKK